MVGGHIARRVASMKNAAKEARERSKGRPVVSEDRSAPRVHGLSFGSSGEKDHGSIVHRVSSRSGGGIAEVRKVILELCASLDLIGFEVPRSYDSVLKYIEVRRRNSTEIAHSWRPCWKGFTPSRGTTR